MTRGFAPAFPALAMVLAMAACGGAGGDAESYADRVEERDTAKDDDGPRGPAAATAMLDKAGGEAAAGADEAAAKAEASAFIDSLLSGYARNQPVNAFEQPATVFEPALAAAVVKAAASEAESGDIPDLLGADPICACQDWDDFSHRIDTLSITGDRATAKVTVRNFGEAASRSFDLVRTPAGWRIFDIDGSFRADALGS